MINREKLASIQTMLRKGESPVEKLMSMGEDELRDLRDAINVLLPEDTVANIDLQEELVSQYRKSRKLYDDVLTDPDVQANQKAQLANSLVAILAQMKKMQDDLMRDRTMQAIETVLIDSIKTLPQEVRDAFYEECEARAAQAGLV